MKELKREKTITYRWWRGDGLAIPAEHIEILDESADERIAQMMKDGYTSGELCVDIHTDASEAEVEYTGWWDVRVKEGGE